MKSVDGLRAVCWAFESLSGRIGSEMGEKKLESIEE
jgi:hypothetical protein